MIICSIFLFTGCDKEKTTSSSLIGKYELKEVTYDGETYNPEKLKSELGRKISLEITKEKVIRTVTYYSTDGLTSDSKEQFLYDEKYLNDIENPSYHFYSYTNKNEELVITNLSEKEEMTFIKK